MLKLAHMTASASAGAVIPPWTLADRLRKAREFAGLKQAELAEYAGISRRSISDYEQALAKPKWPAVLVWAQTCNVPADWLAGDDVPRPPAVLRPRRDSNAGPAAYIGTGSHLTLVGPSTPELVAA